MKELNLSPRLRMLADEVPDGCRFADIGTDHAYLPVYLLKIGRIFHAIATDVRQNPLERGKRHAAAHGVAGRISFRLCDGLSGILPGEADVIAIAGMGGETIAGIMRGGQCPGAYYLLQPMSKVERLRAYLSQSPYRIEKEWICRERGNLYPILAVTRGDDMPLSKAEQWVGRQFRGMDAPLRMQYLEDAVHRVRRALAARKYAAFSARLNEIEETEALCEALCGMREEWRSWQK